MAYHCTLYGIEAPKILYKLGWDTMRENEFNAEGGAGNTSRGNLYTASLTVDLYPISESTTKYPIQVVSGKKYQALVTFYPKWTP